MSRINFLGFPTIKQFSLLFVALRLQSSFLCWILPADKVTHILVWFCLHVLVFLIKPGGSVSYTIYLYFFFFAFYICFLLTVPLTSLHPPNPALWISLAGSVLLSRSLWGWFITSNWARIWSAWADNRKRRDSGRFHKSNSCSLPSNVYIVTIFNFKPCDIRCWIENTTCTLRGTVHGTVEEESCLLS